MDNALQFETVKVALKQDATGYVLTLKVHPDEIPEELLRDFVGARYVVAMVRLNDDESAKTYENRVKVAGITCRSPRFHDWLRHIGVHEKPDEKIATEFVYETCDIKSRTELNGNKQAKQAFDEMMKAFNEWSKDEPF
ncbi:hypothetical protein EBT31_04915 [bacterium]|jgi:hypothetical protein|nr:hypothetical protein [bacterium]